MILICVLVTLSTFYLSPDYVTEFLVFSGNNLLEGRFWTLGTALFVHANVIHLIGNVIFLYVFGNTLEDEIGSGKTLVVFFVGGVVAFLMSLFYYGPNVSMVGSSAAIFALTAVVMLDKPLRFSLFFLMPLGLVAILYFIYNVLAVNYMIQGSVAYISHIIGFAVGLPFGIAWSKQWKLNLLITFGLLILYFIIQNYLFPIILGAIS
jgi:membrane associated rhomboid family serine protease